MFLYISGCSSTIKTPKWYSETYDEKGIKYTTGTHATADDLQTSYQMVRFAAQEELASFIIGQMNGLTKEAKTIMKSGKTASKSFDSAIESIFSADISGASVAKKSHTTKGNMHTAYVLLKYDQNKMEKRLLSKLQAEKELYDELKATEKIKEMRARVDEYKKSGY